MKSAIILVLFFISYFSQSKELIVWADRIPKTQPGLVSSVDIISKEEIKKSNAYGLKELLEQSSGLNITESGPGITQNSIFIRGAASKNVLYLLDGVKLNNPGHPNMGFNPALISLENIERIEVIKGSQSVLYGGNALGGVIAMYTNKDQPSNITYSVGSNEFIKRSFFINKKLAPGLGISFFFQNQAEESPSHATKKIGKSLEEDPYRYQHYSSSINYQLDQLNELSFKANLTHLRSDIDSGSVDDDNSYLKNRNYFLSSKLFTRWLSLPINSTLIFSRSRNITNSNNFIDIGESYNFENQYDYITNNTTTSAKLEFDWLKYLSQNQAPTTKTTAVSLSHLIELNNYIASIGLRLDYHDSFKDHYSIKAALGKTIKRHSLMGIFSTGFKAPSPYELFSTDFGNKNLQPEKSRNTELNYKYLNKRFSLETSLFYNYIYSEISFNTSTSKYQNFGSHYIKGLEQKLTLKLFKNLFSVKMNYTLLDSNSDLFNRPEHLINLTSIFNWSKHDLQLSLLYKGKRKDFSNTQLPSFVVLSSSYNYSFSQKTLMGIKINNILNKEYEDLKGYQSRKFSLLGKLSLSF